MAEGWDGAAFQTDQGPAQPPNQALFSARLCGRSAPYRSIDIGKRHEADAVAAPCRMLERRALAAAAGAARALT